MTLEKIGDRLNAKSNLVIEDNPNLRFMIKVWEKWARKPSTLRKKLKKLA